jgi:hypothetical protein
MRFFYTWNVLELSSAERWSGVAQEDVDESLCEHERLIAAWQGLTSTLFKETHG